VRVVARGDQAALHSAHVFPRSRVRRRVRFGSRGAALALLVLLLATLTGLWNAPAFRVGTVTVQGAERMHPQLVERALGVTGQPVFLIWPSRLEQRLMVLFPHLLSAQVTVGWPARVTVRVVERTPLIAWERDIGRLFIAEDGVGWMPLPEEPAPAVHVIALGPLPPLAPTTHARSQVLSPEVVQLAVQLHSLKPQEATVIYDPQRGLGWRDPRGWEVFFGWDASNLGVRVRVAQATVARLEQQNRRPVLIDLQDLAAPFVMLER